MFALAVLLLIAAAALILWVVFGLAGEHNNQIHFDGFGFSTDLSPITLFALGALALLLIWAATRLIAAGTKRKYRQHKETKALKKEHKLHEEQRVATERDNDALRTERDVEVDRRQTAEARERVAERDLARHDSDRIADQRVADGHVADDRATNDRLSNDRLGNDDVEGRHYRN